MSLQRRHWVGLGMVCTLLVAVGGAPSADTNRSHSRVTEPEKSSGLFLQRGDYPERLGIVVWEVFSAHRFSVPWIALRGPDSSTWFVAERFASTTSFTRLYVRVSPAQKVTASITNYQYVGSDWAIVGKLFADSAPEADAIAGEISSKLSDSGHGATR